MLNPDRKEFGPEYKPWLKRLPKPVKTLYAVGTTSLALLAAACGPETNPPTSQPNVSAQSPELSGELSFGYPFSGLWYLTAGPHSDGLTGGVRAGLDFAQPEVVSCPSGKPIDNRFVEASASGKVAIVGNEKDPTDKNHSIVEIDHGQGLRTGYMHLANIPVTVGEEVKQGGKLGNPSCAIPPGGDTSGIHLHWYAKKDGKFLSADGINFPQGQIKASPNNKDGTLIGPDNLVRTADKRRCGPDENSIKSCGGIRNDLNTGVVLGPNLVPNPSFESGTSLPINWPLWAPGSLGNTAAGWHWETGIAHTGRRSISCVNDVRERTSVGLLMTGFIPVDPLKTYRLGFWIKSSSKETGSGWIVAWGLDSSGNGLPSRGTPVGAAKEDWQLYSGDIHFLTPNSRTTSKVQLGISCFAPDNNTPVYIDDVSFAQILESPPTPSIQSSPKPTFTPTPIPEVSTGMKAAEVVRQMSQEQLYQTIRQTPFAPGELPEGWVQGYRGYDGMGSDGFGDRTLSTGTGVWMTEEGKYNFNVIGFTIFKSSEHAQAAFKQLQSSRTRLISGVGDMMAVLDPYAPEQKHLYVMVDKVLIGIAANAGGSRDERTLLSLANSAVQYLTRISADKESRQSNGLPLEWIISIPVLGVAGLAGYKLYERWRFKRGVSAGVTAGASTRSNVGSTFRIGGPVGVLGDPSNPNTAPNFGSTQPKNPEWVIGQQEFEKKWQDAKSRLSSLRPGDSGNEPEYILDRFKTGMGIVHEVSLDDAIRVSTIATRVRAGIEYLIPQIWPNNRIFERFFDPKFNAGFITPEDLAKLIYLPEKYRTLSAFTNDQRKDVRRIHSVLIHALHPDTSSTEANPALQDSIDNLLKKFNSAYSYVDRLIKL